MVVEPRVFGLIDDFCGKEVRVFMADGSKYEGLFCGYELAPDNEEFRDYICFKEFESVVEIPVDEIAEIEVLGG